MRHAVSPMHRILRIVLDQMFRYAEEKKAGGWVEDMDRRRVLIYS